MLRRSSDRWGGWWSVLSLWFGFLLQYRLDLHVCSAAVVLLSGGVGGGGWCVVVKCVRAHGGCLGIRSR
jgi:hypothetical protein